MFGTGSGGDLWAVVPMDHAVPGCLTPSVPTSGSFPDYQQGFAPLPSPESAAAARPAVWTEEENRAFEAALVEFDGATEDGLAHGIAARIPGKTAEDVREHYRRLVRDLMDIEAGVVELPEYADDRHAATECSDGGAHLGQRQASTRAKPEERKKGIPWTEEEHKRFLEGLEKYGKGDWRSISRNSVVTRTPTQVASHAQKYFLRQNIGGSKERRRSSIHDVTRP